MSYGPDFYKVGDSYVSEIHIARVQFKADGSAVVHTSSDNITTADEHEVEALKDLVGLFTLPDPPAAPAPPPPAPRTSDDPPTPVAVIPPVTPATPAPTPIALVADPVIDDSPAIADATGTSEELEIAI